MATRSNRRSATVARPPQKPEAKSRASTAIPTARTTQVTGTTSLPIDIHRLIASVALALLLVMALLAPLSTSTPNTQPFITPQVDGTASVAAGITGRDIESAIFPYQTLIERSTGNLASTWPDAFGVLNFEPNDLEARRAIVGQLYSSTGGIDTRVRDSGLETNPDPDKLAGIETAYSQMSTTDEREFIGVNGMAMVALLRSLTAAPDQRDDLEREGVVGFQTAANSDSTTWQYTYNWALSNFLIGNYAAAYEGMRSVSYAEEAQQLKVVWFWMGLAALRNGDPDEAVNQFNRVLSYKLPLDADEATKNAYFEARGLAREGLGDAQWARRDPATAYKTYYDTLLGGQTSVGLYRKWLRLGLQQHSYEKMLADMDGLISNAALGQDVKGRIHHDRGRLLSFMGRQSEAVGEYRLAMSINSDDPPLFISLGQAMASQGDYNGALAQAEEGVRRLGKDLNAGDLDEVARAVTTNTSTLQQREEGQELLDAHLLRATVWAHQGNTAAIDTLAGNITANAGQQSPGVAGLLNLYSGYVYEAAAKGTTGEAAAALYTKSADAYSKAWGLLKDTPIGTAGRSAALAGQARTTALAAGKGPQDGIAALKAGGYDPVAIPTNVSNDRDAADILYQGGQLLERNSQQKEAVNAFRVAGVLRNVTDAQQLIGVGRPVWLNNGTSVPAVAALNTADAARAEPGGDPGLAVVRYKQAYSLDPALAPAWNNLGVWYAQQGNQAAARYYLGLTGAASPNYALGNHNLASSAYKEGIGNFLTAEKAQGDAIKASGPDSLRWGYNLRYDERGTLPAPSDPGNSGDFLARLGAIVLLALLLAHTIVGYDRMTNRMGLIPTKGIIGRLGAIVDARVKAVFPNLVTPAAGSRALFMAILIPSLIAMFALAWGAGRGSFEVSLVYLPVALLVALLAFGVNELAQRFAAGSRARTLHHLWPTGTLLGILSIPFGFAYGWQNVTRLQVAGDGAGKDKQVASRGRTSDELDLAYEAQAEAAADSVTEQSSGSHLGGGSPVAGAGRLGLSPASRIMFAGMLANLALGAVFALVYWLTGWPSMRLGLFASMLVLAFTAVSEPPADGWTLYRRNAPLWLGVFVLAATVATLLAVGLL